MLDVLTITLNPAIDQTTYIQDFKIDSVNRISKTVNDPGGKGVNVASYLASSKLKVGATGLLGIDNPSLFKKLFTKLDIKDKFVYVSGCTRTNIKIIDDLNKTVTDLNQKGFKVDENYLKRIEDELFTKKRANWYVFSGSLPEGLDSRIYEKWIKKAHELGVKVALDANAEPLAHALKAKPDLIKPNHHELEYLSEEKLEKLEDYVAFGKKLLKDGIETICISMGKKGAILLKDNEAYLAKPTKVKVNTTVGAGDAMLSGLILAQIKELNLKDSINLATAYSMSSVETVGPYLQNDDKINEHYNNIKLDKLD